MSIQEAIYARQATRSFTTEAVPEEKLQKIIIAGQAAPVGMGQYENYHFTTITSAAAIAKIEAAGSGHPYYGAPAVVIISIKNNGPMEQVSAGAMVENMALLATEQDLASCVVAGALQPLLKDEKLASEIKIPTGFVPCISLAVGYPKEHLKPAASNRHEVASDDIN